MKSFKKTRMEKENSSNDQMEKIKEYSQKSENELMAELIQMATRGKADGTITDESINEFRDRLYPLLNEEQQKRLDSILSNILG